MIRGGYWGGSWGLSWAGAWGEAWLLLNQPYQELSLKGQVFVRSYLTRTHSVEVAEQIVAVAALNNISVIDAESVVTKKSSPALLGEKALKQADVLAIDKRDFTHSFFLRKNIFAKKNDPYTVVVSTNYSVVTVHNESDIIAEYTAQQLSVVYNEAKTTERKKIAGIQTLT